LLSLGFDVVFVLTWFLVKRIFQVSIGFGSISLTNKIGMKKAILLGLMVETIFFIFIPIVGQNILFLFLIVLIKGFGEVTYWLNEFTMFTEVSKKGHAGFERGVVDMFQGAMSLLPPVIGAYILTNFGINYLSIIAALIILSSSIPIFYIKGLKFKTKMTLKNTKKYFKKFKVDTKTIFEIINHGIQDEMLTLFFPMFLFVSGIKIMEIGFVGLTVAFAGIIAPLIFGRISDVYQKKLMLFSTLGFSISWGLVLFLNNYFSIAILSFFLGIFSESVWLAVNEKTTMLGKKYDPTFFGIISELFDDFGRGSLIIIMIPFVFFVGIEFTFIVMSIISFLFVLIFKFRST